MGISFSKARGGWGLLWPQVTICDSAYRSPWTTWSPRTPRCSWIPGMVSPISDRGGGIGSLGKEEPGFLPAGVAQEGNQPGAAKRGILV